MENGNVVINILCDGDCAWLRDKIFPEWTLADCYEMAGENNA